MAPWQWYMLKGIVTESRVWLAAVTVWRGGNETPSKTKGNREVSGGIRFINATSQPRRRGAISSIDLCQRLPTVDQCGNTKEEKREGSQHGKPYPDHVNGSVHLNVKSRCYEMALPALTFSTESKTRSCVVLNYSQHNIKARMFHNNVNLNSLY